MISDGEFVKWYWSLASDDEKKVVDRIGTFEELFSDMIFAPDSITGNLIKCQSKAVDADEWVDDILDVPEELEHFSPTHVHIKVDDLENGCGGCYNVQTDELTIPPKSISDDSVILHEMIHIYETELNKLPFYYHDSLYWALYSSLKKRINDLDTIISDHAHLLNENSIYKHGGLHDILFLLKSFDLDIKMGYKLGTVFDYGYLDDLKDYSYTQ